MIGLSRARVFELMAAGVIPSFKLGKARLIRVSDLEALMASRLRAQGFLSQTADGPLEAAAR
jgi:hypothetical protein